MEEGLKNKFSKAKSQNFTGLITLHKEFFFTRVHSFVLLLTYQCLSLDYIICNLNCNVSTAQCMNINFLKQNVWNNHVVVYIKGDHTVGTLCLFTN